LGGEIYIGCSNGELLRFTFQSNGPDEPPSYTILSRQTLPTGKQIDEIVLLPSIWRAIVLSDHQLYFFALPALQLSSIKPIRNVITFAVDHQHLIKPTPSHSRSSPEPVEFCVIKRNSIALYSLFEQLIYRKDIPYAPGVTLARRWGKYLCVADKENYSMINLEVASNLPVLPLSQTMDPTPFTVQPHITVVAPQEFFVLSWTGLGTLGLFLTGEGDPVRGTLEWNSHPDSLCFDYPYIAALMPDETIEIRDIETKQLVQTVPEPPKEDTTSRRLRLVSVLGRYLVPAGHDAAKLGKTSVSLLRNSE
ncbi:hypothetical protein FISHEDRAFT_32990, partial [Fistulina hepatica ATCC 64428]